MTKENRSSRPNLYSYIVRYDDGAAPNPYGGACTLVICKPAIRRNAKEGDWVVGFGSKSNPTKKDYRGKIVYAMEITKTMPMSEYDAYTIKHLKMKIPNVLSPDKKAWVGDSIYDFSKKGIPKREGVHNRLNRRVDMSGENALLSREFVYFGRNAIKAPASFGRIGELTQGHRSRANEPYFAKFSSWWDRNKNKFAKLRVQGEAQWDYFADTQNSCARGRRKDGQIDNRLDKALGQ
ncbi:MAG: hypothetical protein JRN20_21280 [Nitrososphaerota archaeon]|nr:hypothetical protein [Nitrososphaerota archaeon]